MNTEQLENVLNSDTVTTDVVDGADAVPAIVLEATTSTTETTSKRIYTKKEDMQRGNDAILAALPTEGEGFSKAKIFEALSTEDRALVEHNWNLRIDFLSSTEQVRTEGKKVGKRYWRAV